MSIFRKKYFVVVLITYNVIVKYKCALYNVVHVVHNVVHKNLVTCNTREEYSDNKGETCQNIHCNLDI